MPAFEEKAMHTLRQGWHVSPTATIFKPERELPKTDCAKFLISDCHMKDE